MTEKSFFADTPNAESSPPPENIGLVAEEVALGLKLSLDGLRRTADLNDVSERRRLAIDVGRSVELFGRFVETAPQAGWQPMLVVEGQPATVHRLGGLPGGETALFSADVSLEPGQAYPVNYFGRHLVPQGHEREDTIPELLPGEQWYLGCSRLASDGIYGYAISVNRFYQGYGRAFGFIARPLSD